MTLCKAQGSFYVAGATQVHIGFRVSQEYGAPCAKDSNIILGYAEQDLLSENSQGP